MKAHFFCCSLFLFTLPASAQQNPTIAVLELAGSGIDTSDLSAISNRLRSELFETQKFTVLERGEMESILKEQGFQQTGCTDASCAVQAGQLLNAESIVLGTIDRVGRLFSINVRLVSVKTGAITRNAKSDCADCTLEDVVLKLVRRTAREIAGLESEKAVEVVTEQKGRKTFRYRGYAGGEAGTLVLSTKPQEAEVLVDDTLYGKGNMVVDFVPVGRHRVTVVYNKDKAVKWVAIAYGKSIEYTIDIFNKYHFCLEPGYAFDFPSMSITLPAAAFRDTILEGYGQSLAYPSRLSLDWNPSYPTLNLAWRNRYNVFDLELGLIYLRGILNKEDASGNQFFFNSTRVSGGVLFAYYRNVFNFNNVAMADLGLKAGMKVQEVALSQDYAIRASDLHRFDFQGISQADHESVVWGGPTLAILVGYGFAYLRVTYSGLMGIDFSNSYTSTQNRFSYANSVNFGIVFKM